MPSRRLDDLLPDVKVLALRWKVECEHYGVRPLIYCTLRSAEEQAVLYWQGRSRSTVELKAGRMREAGCPRLAALLLACEDRRVIGGVVTHSGPGESWHQYGVAWDAVPLDAAGRASWADEAGYATMGRAAERLGVEWGGSWTRFTDRPHFQHTGGASLRAMMVELERNLSA